jgi:DNA uptake protein ComE-like DNA-binding protein
MPLERARALTAVDEWSASVGSAWTAAQKTRLADKLVDLAARVEPHIVADTVLAPARLQEYLLRRAIGRLDEWLIAAATPLRRALKIEAVRLRPGSDQPALGLRSASHREVEELPGIGNALAEDIRRHLALYTAQGVDGLLDVDGIGPDRLERLRASCYLDEPSFTFVSPALWAFALAPNIASALVVLDRTDLSLLLGDHGAFARGVPAAAASVFDRFYAVVDLVCDRARLSASGAAGSLASEAERWLSRHEKRRALVGRAQNTPGTVLVNGSYVQSVKARIDASATSISLLVFTGTPTGADDGLAPLPLVEALEAAAGRGVNVRVVLDQDDGGEPYGSLFINRALVNRFRAGAVQVKLDTEQTLLHSKVLVVDRTACVVGSHNWTRAGFAGTHELSVLIDNAAVAAAFGDRFDQLWNSLPAIP